MPASGGACFGHVLGDALAGEAAQLLHERLLVGLDELLHLVERCLFIPICCSNLHELAQRLLHLAEAERLRHAPGQPLR